MRIYVADRGVNAQCWVHQEITPDQWQKLDYILSILQRNFFYDIIIEAGTIGRYYTEVKNATSSISMKIAYRKLRKENEKFLRISKSATTLS